MSVRRSPTTYKPLLPNAKLNGSHQILAMAVQQHQASTRGRCIRWMHFVMPLVFVAVLSSYTTYLMIYQIPRTHSKSGTHAPAAQWRQQQQLQQAGHPRAADMTAKGSVADTKAGVPAAQAAATQGKDKATKVAAMAAAGKAAEANTAAGGSSSGNGGPKPATGPHRPPPMAPVDAATRWYKATGRRMTVAIVNEAPYHLEIVAGFLHVLGQLPVDVTWYQAGQEHPPYGAIELLELVGFVKLLGYMPRMLPSTAKPDPVDFAVFISPEYFEKQTQAFLNAAKPITAVILAHNGMNRALQRISAFDHPRLHFAALAPHVAAASRRVLHIHTHWMMATWPFVSKSPCKLTSADADTCMSGFSIQGNFETQRRNYTRVWAQLVAAHKTGQLPTTPPVKPFHLHLVGRGDVKTLGIPASVAKMTTVHFNLRFQQYYDQIHHTHALLMLLASNNYLVQKMSSTVVSSLMTGTPIIADETVLKSYTFLKPEHVHLMGQAETEMDVMQRVLRMSSEEVYGKRQRVYELAEHLNRRTLQVLQTLMPMEEDAPALPAAALKKRKKD